MVVFLRFLQVIAVILLTRGVSGRTDQNIWKHRLKRSLIHSTTATKNENTIDTFDQDNLDHYFPERKFIRAKIAPLPDVSKRSRIPEVYRDFVDAGSDGSLIVIDADKNSEEQFHKKSDVDRIKHIGDRGINIVLNNNGQNENEARKDEILNEMEDGSDDMEERFSDYVKNPLKHKKLRVILITPLHNQQGYERDNLPEPEDTSLDNLAEVHRGNIVLSENEGNDATDLILSDSRRKSELEIDIDKLKHVKEKLKLLNEDDSHERKLSNDDDISSSLSSSPSSSHEISTKTTSKNDKEKADGENNTHEIKTKIETTNSSNQINSTKLETNVTHENEVKDVSQNHEVKPLTNNSNEVHVDFKPSKKMVHTVADDVDDKKHEVSSTPTEASSTRTMLKPPGNPSPDNSPDLMSQQKLAVENPTKSSHIHTPDSEISKKEKTHEDIPTQPTLKTTIKVEAEKTTTQLPLQPTQTMIPKSETTTKQAEHTSTTSRMTTTTADSAKDGTNKVNNKTEEKQSAEVSLSSHHEKTPPTTTTAHQQQQVEHHEVASIENKQHTNHEIHAITEPRKNENQHELTSMYPSKSDSIDVGNNERLGAQGAPNLSLLPQARIIDKRKAEAIIEFMNKDPLETWRYHFNTLKSLDLNSTILRSGLVNAGNIERLKGVMRRALEGKDVTLSVVGGSISAGGGLYKDRGNIDGLYYKGVVDWWNKMISPLTGSDMIVNNIAIGSIGTDYFSYCIKNHVANETDIVLWELSANDYNRYKMQATKGARPLERLTRQILELPNKPALLYVNFFKGIDYKNSRSSCPDFEDQGEDIIAHYYKIPSLSWRAMVCNGLVRRDPGYSMETLFSNDQYHPSLRGHAQMSLLLLLHLRHVMRAVLQWAISHDGYIDRFEENTALPDPLFMGPKYPVPLCWTLITADLSDRISNSLNVKVVKDLGYKLEYATNFPIRFDKVICWKAEFPSAELVLQFDIPDYYDNARTIKRSKSKIIITTHTRFGGRSSLWLDDRADKAVTIKEGRPNDPGKRTQVDYVADDVEPGLHSLHVKSLDGGFCLASVMVDDS